MNDKDNRHELSSWVRLYTRDMLAWARRRTGDLHSAEDLVQETFLAAAEKIDSFKGGSQPKTWLYGILNNKIAEFYRQRAAHRTVQPEDDETFDRMFFDAGHWTAEAIPGEWGGEPEHLLDNDDFNRVLRECLDRLPRHWHLCMTMKYLEGDGTKKVCQDLGISTTNYWQILHRTKLQLRQCLELHWFTKQ